MNISRIYDKSVLFCLCHNARYASIGNRDLFLQVTSSYHKLICFMSLSVYKRIAAHLNWGNKVYWLSDCYRALRMSD